MTSKSMEISGRTSYDTLRVKERESEPRETIKEVKKRVLSRS